jgi:hypothetical protein
MQRIKQRIARLERRWRDANALSPADVCARAVAFYDYGHAVAPLPEGLSLADRRLVAAILDMLWRTEPANQWADLPPPCIAQEARE